MGSRFKDRDLRAIEADERGGAEAGVVKVQGEDPATPGPLI